MKNNEKLINDLENIPDRFLDEIHDSENETAVVRKSGKTWIRYVSAAACIAAVIAVPVIIHNTGNDYDNIPVNSRKQETTAVTLFTGTESAVTSVTAEKTEASDTSSSEPVTGTPQSAASVTADTGNEITVQVTRTETVQMSPSENTQAPQQEEPEKNEESSASEESGYISADGTDKELIRNIDPDMFSYSPFELHNEDGSVRATYEYTADYCIENAQNLSERYYGAVNNEEELINITRKIFSENLADISGINIVEYIERDYTVNYETGEKTYVTRIGNPYDINYYEEYDVWYIKPAAFRYETNGKAAVSWWESAPYLMVRGSDGKILAFWK